MNATKKKMSTETLALGAVMTALVIVLQCLATYTTFFGPFSTAIGLIPIVVGAAMCGAGVGAWLGFVFGVVVLATGGGALFFMFSFVGTIVTVLVKGTACGLASGLTYKFLNKYNGWLAVFASAIICPIVNTGIFLLGSAVFFLKHADAIAAQVGLVDVSGMDVFFALAFGNFLFELGMNVVLGPVIVRIINMAKNKK